MTYYGYVATILFFIAYALRIIVVLRLKKHHDLIWGKLGKPSVFYKGDDDAASVAVTSFFLRGEFFAIDDKVLKLECVLFDLSLIVCIGAMIVSFFY